MRGCIYGKNISLVNASFMEIPWTDLLAENRYLGNTRYLPCTKERNRYAVSTISPSNRARNSEWEISLPGSSKSFWDTLLVYGLSMDHQKGRSRCRHNLTLEQASFDSKRNLESPFEALINCINTRSLACGKKIRLSSTPPQWWGWVEKNISLSGRTLYSVLLRSEDRFFLDRNLR